MHRFFLPSSSFVENTVAFPPATAHQLTHVLRLRVGDSVIVLDNSGWEFEVSLTSLGRGVAEGQVRRKSITTAEPRTKITLFQSILKSDRFDYVLQKCTEVGVTGFVPMLCDRSVVPSLSDITEAKIERWQRIIQEASEQSGRGKLPHLHKAVLFEQACSMAAGVSFLPWESERSTSLRVALARWDSDGRSQSGPRTPSSPNRPQRPFSINVFIGPEGGFSPEEIKIAKSFGVRPVTLGPRILRAETAGLVSAAAILYEWGDLGG